MEQGNLEDDENVSMFPCNESWTTFYSHWHKVMYAASESDFEQNWNQCKTSMGETL
jgi:hypothetical protein